ncbi:hypothetical protein ACLOJK_039458 [Asimina triloba]
MFLLATHYLNAIYVHPESQAHLGARPLTSLVASMSRMKSPPATFPLRRQKWQAKQDFLLIEFVCHTTSSVVGVVTPHLFDARTKAQINAQKFPPSVAETTLMTDTAIGALAVVATGAPTVEGKLSISPKIIAS